MNLENHEKLICTQYWTKKSRIQKFCDEWMRLLLILTQELQLDYFIIQYFNKLQMTSIGAVGECIVCFMYF